MNKKRAILEYDFKNEKQKFFNELLKNCYFDMKPRQLHCKKCENLVQIDWLKNLAFYGFHVISKLGIEYRKMSYELSL